MKRLSRDARRMMSVLVAIAVFELLSPPRAAAYIDPLSGSIVLQVLFAGLMAAYLTIRRFRDYLASVMRKLFSRFRS